jgi:hypothetical protein
MKSINFPKVRFSIQIAGRYNERKSQFVIAGTWTVYNRL